MPLVGCLMVCVTLLTHSLTHSCALAFTSFILAGLMEETLKFVCVDRLRKVSGLSYFIIPIQIFHILHL